MMMLLLVLTRPPPAPARPVYLILPPRMLGVLAQNAHMYTCDTSCGVDTSTHRPWSKHSHESLLEGQYQYGEWTSRFRFVS